MDPNQEMTTPKIEGQTRSASSEVAGTSSALLSADIAATGSDRSAESPTLLDSSSSRAKSQKPERRWGRLLVRIALALLLVPVLQVLVLRVVNPPVTTMMIFRAFDHLFAGESALWSHTNVSRTEIAPSMYSAVVAAEDQRFFQHHGFDLVEIEKAQQAHARHPNRPMRGASTLSQQVAKNLFLPPWHSFIRKGVEAYYTVLIEVFWPKERILQMYLNIAEFAPNVYGAEAGAEHHFHRHASQLSAQQSAQMAAVLPNPTRWNASRPSGYIQRRSARILRQMRGIPTDEDDDVEPD